MPEAPARTGAVLTVLSPFVMSLASPSPGAFHRTVVARVHAISDVGLTREHNEDSFLVANLEDGVALEFTAGSHAITAGPHGLLFTVADGMGGAASGEIASSMAVRVIADELRARWVGQVPTVSAFALALRDAAEEANRRIHGFATEHPEHRGMGTTATVVGVLGDHLYLTQVGDSRAYLVREQVAYQLTKDQSLMQRLIDAGEITEEEAEQSERRNIILQALGPESSVLVDLTQQQVRRGDVLIVCSDGLSGQVRSHEIAAITSETTNVRVICERLIAIANDRGGPDNITVVTVRFDGSGLDPILSGDEVGYTAYPLAGTMHEAPAHVTGSMVGFATSVGIPAVRRATPARTEVFQAMERSRTPGSSPLVGAPHSGEPPRQRRPTSLLPWMVLVLLAAIAATAWMVLR